MSPLPKSSTAAMSSDERVRDNSNSRRDDLKIAGATLGEGPKLDESKDMKIRVPRLDLDEFCDRYSVGENIKTILEKQGFKTAGALVEISEATLIQADLKIGEIGELRRAVREFLSNAMIDEAAGTDS